VDIWSSTKLSLYRCPIEDVDVGDPTRRVRQSAELAESSGFALSSSKARTSFLPAKLGTRIAVLMTAGHHHLAARHRPAARSSHQMFTRLAHPIHIATALLLLAINSAWAAEINVAVAANFTEPAKEIAAAFKQNTGHTAVLSFGASGQFYSQITQGAPFQVFLSADAARPKKLVDDGLAVPDSRFTYAIGKLVLWSKTPGLVQGEATLKSAVFGKLSICNPVAAPYGAAAVEVMKSLGVYDAMQPKLVEGATITQAYQFVETGNAELGFVALSQLSGNDSGSRWLVPQELYAPIRQDAVLLKTGDEAAIAFISFLRSVEARAIVERYGYMLDGQS
jgi:molybdate transport system substrate-binding protein